MVTTTVSVTDEVVVLGNVVVAVVDVSSDCEELVDVSGGCEALVDVSIGCEEVDVRDEDAIVELPIWRTAVADAVELFETKPKTARRMIAPSAIHCLLIDTESRPLASMVVIPTELGALNYGV